VGEEKDRGRVGEGKSRGGEGGKGLCSSKNSFKKPRSWTLADFETDRRPCLRYGNKKLSYRLETGR